MKKILGFALLALFALALNSCKNPATSPTTPGATFTLLVPYQFSQMTGSNITSGSASFNHPSGVAMDGNGNFYVADGANNRVVKFDAKGNYLLQFGGSGQGNGQFSEPYMIALDNNGNIYVSDVGNNRVEEFHDNGLAVTCVAIWGGPYYGSNPGQFNGPVGVALDANGYLYVADSGNYRIQKFLGSNFIAQFNAPSGTAAYLDGPQQIAIDSSGNLYVACNIDSIVKKLDENGNYISQIGPIGPSSTDAASGVALDGDGYIYVTEQYGNALDEYDTNGNLIARWGGSAGSSLGQFYYPFGLAIDKSRNVYVADYVNNRIEIMSTTYDFSGLKTLGVFPNPVKSGQDADIAFQLSSTLNFSITIKDTLGNMVNQYQGQGVQGDNLLQWNMTAGGNLIDPGVYIVSFQSGSTQATTQLSYVR